MSVISMRTNQNQDLHDRVVKYIESSLDSTKYDIHTNPGQEKNWHIRGQFPDILLTPKGSKSVQFVLEVETSDTITAEETRNQWKEYANLPGTFYLIVPKESLELAKIICAAQGIPAKFGYFTTNVRGEVIDVNYL